MISPIKKSQILSNRYAFESNEEILVHALDLCDELIENERLKRMVERLKYENEILKTRIALRSFDCPEYRRIDLKA